MATRKTRKDPDLIEASFEVPFTYSVRFTHDVFGEANTTLKDALAPSREGQKPRVLLVADSDVVEKTPGLGKKIGHYVKVHGIELAGPAVIVPGGERSKSDSGRMTWQVIDAALKAHLDRQSYIVAMGGGAVLDAGGFAAAVLHRGVRLVRLPTTVLAQNDAGIGVKNAIDTLGFKNAIGAFAPPWAVIDDLDFLKTLADDDWRGGIAEAVKVAAIKDAKFLKWIAAHAEELKNRDATAMEELVRETARLHVEHIVKNGDPFERGTARPLDFGHWAAHRLETMSGYRLSHGYAVAIGVCIDCAYAVTKKWLDEEDGDLVGDALAKSGALGGLDRFSDLLAQPDQVLRGLDDFREHLGGELTVTFPGPLGKKREEHEVDRELMKQIIGELKQTCQELAGKENGS